MSKKKKNKQAAATTELIVMENCSLFGSLNGWLKAVTEDGGETIFKPKEHTLRDEPITWYKLGEYEYSDNF